MDASSPPTTGLAFRTLPIVAGLCSSDFQEWQRLCHDPPSLAALSLHRAAAIVVPLSISNLQQGRHNFLSTSQIVTKIGGGVSHVKIALEPRLHAQENSEP